MARGFTLVEMLTTVAALVILLGLMVSLARDVRRRSATELSNEILARLDDLMGQYAQKNDGRLPAAEAVIVGHEVADEQGIRTAAWKDNEDTVKALRSVSLS